MESYNLHNPGQHGLRRGDHASQVLHHCSKTVWALENKQNEGIVYPNFVKASKLLTESTTMCTIGITGKKEYRYSLAAYRPLRRQRRAPIIR